MLEHERCCSNVSLVMVKKTPAKPPEPVRTTMRLEPELKAALEKAARAASGLSTRSP
jgi:hypothetical protein